MSRRKRLITIARRVLYTAAATVLFGVLGGLTVLATILAWPEIAKGFIAEQLSQSLEGTVRIQAINSVGSDGIRGLDLTIEDPSGRQVLKVWDASVSFTWPKLVAGLTEDEGPLTIPMEGVDVGALHIDLSQNQSGDLRLLQAVASTSEETSEPSRPVEFFLNDARLGSTWIYADARLGSSESEKTAPVDLGLANTEFDFSYSGSTLSVSRMVTQASIRSPEFPPGNVDLVAQAHVEILGEAKPDSLPVRGEATLHVATAESVLRVEATATASGFKVDAKSRISPRLVSAGSISLSSPADVEIHAEGTLDDVSLSLAADHEESHLNLTAQVETGTATSIQGTLSVEQLSASLFSEANVSPLTGQFEFRFTRSDETSAELDRWTADISAATESFAVEETRIPPLGLSASLQDRTIEVRVKTRDGTSNTVFARARLDEEGGVKRVHVEGDLKNLDLGSEGRIKQLTLRGEIEGDFSSPRLDVAVSGRGLSVAGRDYETFAVEVVGPPERIAVNGNLTRKTGSVLVSAVAVADGAGVEVQDIALKATGGEEEVSFTVDELSVKEGTVEFCAFRVNGVGSSNLSGRISPTGISLKGFVRDVNVADLAEAVAVELPVSGVLDLDVDLRLFADQAIGRLRAVLIDVEFQDDVIPIPAATRMLHLELAGNGPQLAVTARADLERLPESKDDEYLETTVRFWTPSFRTWTDGARILDHFERSESRFNLDLGRFAEMSPDIRRLGGRVSGEVQAHRASIGAEPHISSSLLGVHLQALIDQDPADDGLADEDPVDEDPVDENSAPLLIDDVGFDLHFSSDPETSHSSLALHVSERGADAFWSTGSAERSVFQVALTFQNDSWHQVPIKFDIQTPRLHLQNLPGQISTPQVEGVVHANVQMEGTAADPELRMHVETEDLGLARQVGAAPRYFGSASGRFHDGALSWNVDLQAEQERTISGSGTIEAHVEPEAGVFEVDQASGKLSVRKFPLNSIVATARHQVQGWLDLDLQADNIGTARESISLEALLREVGAQKVTLDQVEAHAQVQNSILSVDLKAQAPDHSLSAQANARLERDGPWLVTGVSQPSAELKAENFPLELLRPALSASIAGLRGRLNADVAAETTDKGPLVYGTLSVRDGAVQVPGAGQRLNDIRADLVWRKDGSVELKNTSFRGGSGRGTLSVKAQTVDLLPRSIEARVRVERNERLPISFAGMGTGEVWGDITTSAQMDFEARKLSVNTDIDELQVRFPTLPTQSVQSLSSAEHVKIGTQISNDEFETIPMQPIVDEEPSEDPWSITANIDLGDRLWLAQGTNRRVQVAGDVELNIEEELRTSGTVRLPRGNFELNGRMFEIHEGTITLQPDAPDNPVIVAEAHWQSDEGTLVIARFSGPAQSGEMSLHSEPPLRNDQILSLLLFGDTAGLEGGGGGNSSNQAAVVGGSVATQGINNALRKYEAIDLSTQISGEEGNVRPELVIQLTNSLSAQLGYNLEEPSPGNSPDRTLLTFELRLVGGSSLSLTAGDRGTTLFDWVWRYRY